MSLWHLIGKSGPFTHLMYKQKAPRITDPERFLYKDKILFLRYLVKLTAIGTCVNRTVFTCSYAAPAFSFIS